MIQDPCLRSVRQAASLQITYPPTAPIQAPSPYIAPILLALHLLAEDYKAYTNKFDELAQVVRLVIRLASVAQRDWAQHWMRECPFVTDPAHMSASILRSSTIDRRLDFPPPNLMMYTSSYFAQDSKQRYFVLPQIGKLFGVTVSNIMGTVDPCRRSSMLLEIYSALRSPQDGALHISQTVHHMSLYGLSPGELNTVPLGIALPLWEALRRARYRPPSTAPRRFYQLCGREDLAMTVFGNDRALGMTESFKQRNEPDEEHQFSVSKLYGEAYVSLAGRAKEETTGVGDPRVRHFTDVRFPEDYRLREVETMLRSSRTCIIRVQDRPDLSDHQLANDHQLLIMHIAERTLSLPLGRAALTFATVPTAQADSYSLPPLEFAVKLLPQGSVLNLDGARLTDDVRFWTEFNNAVAAALRIAPATEGVDYSWIILLNKPPELSSKHAGFIYGLGLTGHLRSMLPFQAFGYLAPKHMFTTIAVLLGLAAAHCGTGNETVTQMISVHTPALLPPNSAELNIPVLTQAAGLMGLGLLYLGTRNRKMARVALQEISRKDLVKPGQTDEHRESYALSAGFAFGFIMVGKGAQSNPADMAMVQQLQLLIHGETPAINQVKYQKQHFDVTITAPAAIVALMLMFMRTERQDIADLLRPPKTREELTHYAPYLIMLRTIARSVIMWNSVSLKVDWLYANLPEFLTRLLKKAPNAGQVLAQLDDASSLAYMYTIAGLCFGIGLRYVGSAEPEALTRLSMLHDAANKAMALSMTAYDQRIKRFAYKECVGAIQLAMAMVAAGTGELSIFQRLRVAHGQYSNVRYGTHVATHLSLGLLFLGNGRYTLGNSNAAIACLIASLYPRFPNNAADNRAHPQMLRHLWVLAAEPRCLITRDVDTGKIVGLPVRLRKKERSVETAQRMMAPSLLPEIENIVTLDVDSPRYSPLSLDIMNNPRHRASMIRDQTMWVKRQPGFLTYEEDIRGTRNINLHTNVAYLDTLPLDFPSEQPLDPDVTEHLFSFMKSSAHSMRTVAFAKYLCRQVGASPRENALFAFSHAALVECLALDKLNMLHAYLSVFLSRYDHPADNMDAVTVVRSLRAAATFYETQFSRFMDEGMSVNRSVTLRPSLIQSALTEAEKTADALSLDPGFRSALQAYIRGEGLAPDSSSDDDPSPNAESSMQGDDEDMGEVDGNVLARELSFFLAVYNFPPLKVLLEARERGRTASRTFGGSPQAVAQLPGWLALLLLKGGTAMSGERQPANDTITTRAVEEVIKAWTR
ncbi:hypothetical protein CALCODRAFT_499449 [Calocera cornea HHB12733]|uniref:Uncharacterized protein n=1 Tax=Calocera cornea HHB12733 TaxID=1353952 RepID=A0A165EFG6_9BASI|nr:hypothetical protein CALCODRAFT_499449 [Calocera cornea HHB12733]